MNLKKLGTLIFSVILTSCAGKTPKLGIETDKLMECPKTPNCVNSQVSDKEHFIEPMISNQTPLETKESLVGIVNGMKNSEIKEVKDDYIRVEFVSTVFRFVDDVEFYFPNTKSKNVIVHVRSASRIGRSDFGVNRKRIEKIRKQL